MSEFFLEGIPIRNRLMRDPFFFGNPHYPNVPKFGGKRVLMGPDSILGCHEVSELKNVIILREGWNLFLGILQAERISVISDVPKTLRVN